MQYRSQGLWFLPKYTSGNSLVSGIKGFEAEFRKNKTFHLRKLSAHWSDSAKYICAVSHMVTEILGGADHNPLRLYSLKDSGSQPGLSPGSWHVL